MMGDIMMEDMTEIDPIYPRICQVTDSSNVIEICYDPSNLMMQVTFANGARYVFHKTSPVDFAQIISAQSVGKEFNYRAKSWKGVRLNG